MKNLVVFGVFLLFLGLVLFSLRDISLENFTYDTRVAISKTYGSGQYSTNWKLETAFYKEEYLGVNFRPAADWSLPDFDEAVLPPLNGTTYRSVKFLDINVTSPSGNFTSFTVYLIITKPYGGADAVTVFPDYFNVSQQEGGLIVEDKYPEVENIDNLYAIVLGKTTEGGNYTITFTLDYKILDLTLDENGKPIPWNHDPTLPPYVWIYGIKKTLVTMYPYSFFTYVGPSVCTIGILVLVYSKISKSKNKRLKKS